jgi:hypothetical protein
MGGYNTLTILKMSDKTSKSRIDDIIVPFAYSTPLHSDV